MWKYILAIVMAAIVVMACKVLYDNYKLKEVTAQLNEQLMEANVTIGKAHTQFGEAQNKIKELSKQIQYIIDTNNEMAKKYSELYATYLAVVSGAPHPVDPTGDPVVCNDSVFDPGMYYIAQTKTELIALGLEIPNAYSDHRIDILCKQYSEPEFGKDFWPFQQVDYELHLNLKIKMMETIGPTGAVNNYAEVMEVGPDGKEIGKFEITKYEVVVEDQRNKHFQFWNPHLDLGVLGQVNQNISIAGGGSLGISFLSYGLTKNDLEWRFLRLGADLTKDSIGLSFTPAQYNFGSPLPLVSNLYAGFFGSINLRGEKALGFNFTVMM
jgi:hypothetical protein